MKLLIAWLTVMLISNTAVSQDTLSIENKNDLKSIYQAVLLNRALMNQEYDIFWEKDMYQKGEIGDSYLKLALIAYPNVDSVNYLCYLKTKELYKEIYSDNGCKYLSENIFNILKYIEGTKSSFQKENIKIYLKLHEFSKDESLRLNIDDWTETTKAATSLISSKFDYWEERDIRLSLEVIQKSLLLNQCYNP